MWYRTGTINVTNGSTSVTGVGTAWVSNAAIGEALLAPDGKLYEVANIASDTSITLGSVYLGATQSGQAYVIVPSQSYIRDLAAQAAALVNNYSSFYNTVGQGKFPDGTLAAPAVTFASDTDTGFYRSAANEFTFVANGVAQFKCGVGGLTFINGSVPLSAISDLTPAADRIAYYTSASAAAMTTITAAGRALIDDADATAQRTTLGLGNVDNTSDADKNSAVATLANKTLIAPVIAGGTIDNASIGSNSPSTGNFTIVGELIRMNPSVVSVNLTIPSGFNASSIGPLEVAEGVTIALNDNSNWSIL